MLERGLIRKIGFTYEVIAAFFSIISVAQAGPLRGWLPTPRIVSVRGRLRQQPAEAVTAGGRFTQNRRLHPGPQHVRGAVGELLTAAAATRPSWSL